MAGPGAPGGFDYNQWAAMNLKGGGSDSGDVMTPDSLTKKSVDSFINTALNKVLGMPINTNIEGKSMFAGLEAEESVGKGLSLTNVGMMGMLRDIPGGLMAQILKYFTRDITNLTEGAGGEGGSASGGGATGDAGGGDTGGGGGDGAAQGSSYQGGGGDFPSFNSRGGDDMPDVQVNYGGKMISGDAMIADLGNLRPSATPSASSRDTDVGVGV